MVSSTYGSLFNQLDVTIDTFIAQLYKQNPSGKAAGEWSVRDVLRHIVFWHRYYAQQYMALAHHSKPVVFTSVGGSTRNKEGVYSLKDYSDEELVTLLRKAQEALRECIVLKKVPQMKYTNRREYSTEEFLTLVIRHITKHTEHIRKAKS